MNDEEITVFECFNCKQISEESELLWNAPATCPECQGNAFRIYADLNDALGIDE